MQQLINIQEREQFLEESIKELDSVNKKLSKLILRKEELTEELIGVLGHEKEGQCTYEHNIWKIEVKTPYVYSLDKKLYESLAFKIPKQFNPIKESKSYTIDKKMCERVIQEAPEEIRDVLIDLIEKRPGKASVNIKERM